MPLWWTARKLDSPDAGTRKMAAESLTKSGNPAAFDALCRALQKGNAGFRMDAAEQKAEDEAFIAVVRALGALKDGRATGPLLEKLKSSVSSIRVRDCLLAAIREIGAGAVPFLRASLHPSVDRRTRAEAAELLGDTGGPAEVDLLVGLLGDNDSWVRRRALTALEKLAWQPKGGRDLAIVAVITERWRDLVKMGPAAVEPMLTLCRPLSKPAIEALGKIRDRRAIEPLKEALQHDDLRHSAAAVTAAAAWALGEIGDVTTVASIALAVGPLDESVAKEVLVRKFGARAVEPLLPLATHPRDDVRRVVIHVLATVGGSQAVPALVAALHDRHRWIRDLAGKALQKLGWKPSNDEELALLAIRLDDWAQVERVGRPALPVLLREGAFVSREELETFEALLGRIDPEWRSSPAAAESTPMLADTISRAGPTAGQSDYPEDWSPYAATYLLGIMRNPAAVQPLVTAVKHPSFRMRELAARSLGMLGDPRAVEPLVAALSDKERAVRRAAVQALGEIGDARAGDGLVAMLKEDPSRGAVISDDVELNREVHVMAFDALRQVTDPRTLEVALSFVLDSSRGFREHEILEKATEILGDIGDESVAGVLAASASRPEMGEASVSALRALLTREASRLSTEDLQTLAALDRVRQFEYGYPPNGNMLITTGQRIVDTTTVSTLAAHELRRRQDSAR